MASRKKPRPDAAPETTQPAAPDAPKRGARRTRAAPGRDATPRVLAALRAPGHRAFVGPNFGALGDLGGPDDDPIGLSYLEIMADPRLAALGRQVFDDLRRQFASDQPRETDEEEAYRQRLEGWADALEVLLEEVLDELATLGSGRAGAAPDPTALA